jgi:hypothetical protein
VATSAEAVRSTEIACPFGSTAKTPAVDFPSSMSRLLS